MALEERQTQTNSNVREKANLIWEIATHLYGEYKPHEYGRVILPMTVIKRFDDCLKDTKQKVLEQASKVANMATGTKDAVLQNASGYAFYNTSKFDFEKLLADSDNITENFNDYLSGYSDNVKDIIAYFEFDKEITKMSQNDLLYTIIQEFNKKSADMSPKKITPQDMGYVFEELVRKFSESYDEQAGAHFTSRDIIYLMTELLVAPEKDNIKEKGGNKTAYDMTMGTSQMLACLDEKLKDLNGNINLICYGQEFNPETFAIAKADMLIKGKDANNMKFGDTLSNDQFEDYTFDYIISNPPFGIDWKKEQSAVIEESKRGFSGRFGPGLPGIGDGQMLFTLNGIKKLKDNGRMTIIQNGSSLFSGDAGSGPSEIRKYVLENDFLEAVIQLPNDLFYNTGIVTYIWVISKSKEARRKNKVQLISAQNCYLKRRKNIGNKRVDLDDACIKLIMQAYNDFVDEKLEIDSEIFLESKVFENSYFGYVKIATEAASKDSKGNRIVKNGHFVPVKGCTDYEIIPLNVNVKDYFEKNVRAFNKDAFYYCDNNGEIFNQRHELLDSKHNKIGYEIPFSRIFNKYVEPTPTATIFEEYESLEEKNKKINFNLNDIDDKNFVNCSSIPFVKTLPSDWQLIPNKYLFKYDGKQVGADWKDYQLLSLTTAGVKPKDINASGGKVPDSYDKYQTVKPGQMVFCLFDLDVSAVFSGISEHNGMITSAYDVFSSTELITNEFADYWFKYVFSNRYYKMYSKNIRYTISGEMFRSVLTPVPSIEEQKKISTFLKEKETEIDEKIEILTQEIDKLKEYKKSLIFEYVTGKRKA